MASATPTRRVTPRDLDLFQALDRCPLTVAQLLKISQTFAYPFTTERRVQERLHDLAAAGRVRRWLYATAGRGELSYYTLSPLGYQLLYGADAPLPHSRRFGEVGLARQPHTRALADFIVHTVTAVPDAGVLLADFWRENTLRLPIGQESLYPDCAFQLVTPDNVPFMFFVELDNVTERVSSTRYPDSWERKLQLYDRYQDSCGRRFRVLAVTTGSDQRLRHILDQAARTQRNPQRSLAYGITLGAYLQAENALTDACFRNHRQQLVSLLPAQRHSVSPVARAATAVLVRAGSLG